MEQQSERVKKLEPKSLSFENFFHELSAENSYKNIKFLQQPTYVNSDELQSVVQNLSALDPFVQEKEIHHFSRLYQDAVDRGDFFLTSGDCAERFCDAVLSHVLKRSELVQAIHTCVETFSGRRVFSMARMGGQFAKPRSEAWEHVGGSMIPCFRGENINGIAPDRRSRESDPGRMLLAADAIQKVLRFKPKNIFTAHEALLLSQEFAFTKRVGEVCAGLSAEYFNHSSHFLWVGERTRQLDSAHLHYVAKILNPIGLKIGPETDIDELTSIVNFLFESFPQRTSVSLITRLGVRHVSHVLPLLIKALKKFQGKVVWICDPMHGNVRRTAGGIKTRAYEDIVSEIEQTFEIHNSLSSCLQGLHLETSPDAIRECVGGPDALTESDLTEGYQSYCDPRLNYSQAISLAKFVGNLLKEKNHLNHLH